MAELASQTVSKPTALVLAAHGWGADDASDPRLTALAQDLVQRTTFDQVVAAYHRGSPRFSEVLDGLTATDVVVVPFMTSEGYFCTEVLPREIAKNRRYELVSIRQTAPVGVDARLFNLVVRRAGELMERFDVSATDTTLAVVGHGTMRYDASRQATIELVEALAHRFGSLEVIPAFLDDEPAVDDVVDRATGSNIIVVPFLMADGHHALRDVPARIGLDPVAIDQLPTCGSVNGRTVVFDSAVGMYKGIAELVAIMAEEAR